MALIVVAGLGSASFAQSGANNGAITAPSLVPYTSKLIAGGGPTATYTVGGTCPVSGFTETDTYGDGCLASEIVLVSARYATADTAGNIFFSDYTNGLVRRVDAITGVVTAVAGGATASPTTGATCGALKSTDTVGDGCLANAVKLKNPTGLAFDSKGNLYFADSGLDLVREVLATNGVISLVAGNAVNYGYNVNNTSTTGPVIAATQSYLNFPYGLAFDSVGNLYIADEGNNAISLVNLTGASETVQGLTVPTGTIAKVAGYGSLGAKTARSGDCPDFVSTATGARGGCYFGTTFTGTTGVTANLDAVYSIALDQANNLYFANEFQANSGVILPNNNIYNFAGQPGSTAVPKANATTRGAAGSFPIGSSYGIAADTSSNVYISDASSGLIWRVDGPLNTTGGQPMYVVAGGVGGPGGPTAVCGTMTDTYGDGCPALQSKIGSSGSTTTGFASNTAPGPGIYGLSIDAYSDLFFGDTETALVREIASGTQFGVIGANQPTNTLDIHFPAGDGPSTTVAPYTLTAGTTNFSIGTAACTTNSDKTVDCLLPLTATPSVLGAFTGTLQVKSQNGGSSSFPLNGTYAQSPVTRTVLTYTTTATCTGTTTYSTTTPVTLTATLIANGPNPPVGAADTITFFANNGTTTTTLGTFPVSNIGSTTNPVYGAKLTQTFTTTGTYTFTATYSGDAYFKTSTGKSSSTLTTANPSYTVTAGTFSQPVVTAGQTGLYNFTVGLNVYTGTVSFACSGLPANSSCVFSPATIVGAGCSSTSTVALSILTNPRLSPIPAGFAGRGPWSIFSIVLSLGLALFIGSRRKRIPLHSVWMALALLIASTGLVACATNINTGAAATPTGAYTITVTAAGSSGAGASFTVPLTVN